jgi:DNA-binding MarR family transcriptional regulator
MIDDLAIESLSIALERTGSWIRRMTPRQELNTVSLSTLDVLVSSGPLRISELVAHERISQPGMTGLITRLADAGYVERRSDPADGRAALVAATKAGKHYLGELHADRAAALAERIRRLPMTEQRNLYAAIGALQSLIAPVPANTQEAR